VLSGRGLCDELITRPEESYQLWCVVVCYLETSRIGAPYIYDISSLRVNLILLPIMTELVLGPYWWGYTASGLSQSWGSMTIILYHLKYHGD